MSYEMKGSCGPSEDLLNWGQSRSDQSSSNAVSGRFTGRESLWNVWPSPMGRSLNTLRASEELFRDPRHKHAMRFCTVCVTDVEAAGDALSPPYLFRIVVEKSS